MRPDRAADSPAPPGLDRPYELTDEVRERFARDGHVALPGVLAADELDYYRQAVRRAVAANIQKQHGFEAAVAANENNWQFVDNLWTQDPEVRILVHSPRLARIAADLMGVDRIRLFRDQSYFKGPGGAGTPWHQDGPFIPLDSEQMVTAWVAFSDMSPRNAPMSYATGSHRAGFLGVSQQGDKAMRDFETRLTGEGYPFQTYDSLRAGDVAFHSVWTMHGTYANDAPDHREAVVIVYFADGARVVHDDAGGQMLPQVAHVRANNRAVSLRGLPHGAPAVTDMTPLLFDRAADGQA